MQTEHYILVFEIYQLTGMISLTSGRIQVGIRTRVPDKNY